MFQLPVKGTDKKKWVLLCNLWGGPAGGSATQYFVGDFDGHRFVNESPQAIKWMDWGKDHYATVTWSNAPANRTIALAWMSNWQYANQVPTQQFRSANSVPRELYLYQQDGETYLASVPVDELLALRQKPEKKGAFKVSGAREVRRLLKDNTGTYEIELQITDVRTREFGFQLTNAKGENVRFTYNLDKKQFAVDRTQSGITSFHEGFPAVASAPLVEQGTYTLRLLVDKCSIEAFDGDGRFTLTNLVFPDEPYNHLKFFSNGGSFRVASLNIYKLNN